MGVAALCAAALAVSLAWYQAKPARNTSASVRTPSPEPTRDHGSSLMRLASPSAEPAVLLLRQRVHDDEGHPHPITVEHARLARERGLIARLNQAVDFRDGATLRALVAEYRRDFPENEQGLQEGYGVIADCLTSPGETSLRAAESFYDAHRGSILRRWVRRVCLDAG